RGYRISHLSLHDALPISAGELRQGPDLPQPDLARARARTTVVKLTRRDALAGAAAAALGGVGVYELVDRLSGSAPARSAVGGSRPPEQHLLDSLAVIEDDGVAVVVPPLHHQLMTATVRAGDPRRAARELE